MIKIIFFLFVLSCQAAEFSVTATETSVTLNWNGLEDLEGRSVHFAVEESGTDFLWKWVEGGSYECGIPNASQTASGQSQDDTCNLQVGQSYDIIVLYTQGTTQAEIVMTFSLPEVYPTCQEIENLCPENTFNNGGILQCTSSDCSSDIQHCCSEVYATYIFPAGEWTYSMTQFYTSDLAELMEISLEAYYEQQYGVTIRFSSFDFVVDLCCNDVCTLTESIICESPFEIRFHAIVDNGQNNGQASVSESWATEAFTQTFHTILDNNKSFSDEFYDLYTILYGYYMEASFFPISISPQMTFQLRVDNVRDDSKVDIYQFTTANSGNLAFDVDRILEIINSGSHVNGETYSWLHASVERSDGVTTTNLDGFQEHQFFEVDLVPPTSADKDVIIFSFVQITNPNDPYGRVFTTWLSATDGTPVDLDVLADADRFTVEGPAYVARIGFVEEDIFRLFSTNNFHFWHGRTTTSEALASVGGYGASEYYLIVSTSTDLGLSDTTMTDEERAAAVVSLVEASATDPNLCGAEVHQHFYEDAHTGRLNCENFFAAGETYNILSVAENGDGSLVFSAVNLAQTFNLFEPLVTNLEIETGSSSMQLSPFEFQYEMENAKSDGYVWWVVTELAQAMDYQDIREGKHAVNNCKTDVLNGVSIETGVHFDGISAEAEAAGGVDAIPQQNPLTAIVAEGCFVQYRGQHENNEYKLHLSYDARGKTDAGASLDFIVEGWKINVHFMGLYYRTTVALADVGDAADLCGQGELEVQHNQINQLVEMQQNFCGPMIPNDATKIFEIIDSGEHNGQLCKFNEHEGCTTSNSNSYGPQIITCVVTEDTTLEVPCKVVTDPPTNSPTDSPTLPPTDPPTLSPTNPPTDSPTLSPTNPPTLSPTNPPTGDPTNEPTHSPTDAPTNPPTGDPTNEPTHSPTDAPTNPPTGEPTNEPTHSPTDVPTTTTVPPTPKPTPEPTTTTTTTTTARPTMDPTSSPTDPPTRSPTTTTTTERPTLDATMSPTCPAEYMNSEECCDCWRELAECYNDRYTCLHTRYSNMESCASSSSGRRMLSVESNKLEDHEIENCEPLSEAHQQYLTHKVDMDDLCHFNNVIYYQYQSTCIGYGHEDDECSNGEHICSGLGGKVTYGHPETQVEALLFALESDNRVHVQCPKKLLE